MGQSSTNSVIVMVDLSLNINDDPNPISGSMRTEAIEFARSMITATYDAKDFPDWEQSGVFLGKELESILNGAGKPLIGKDDFLMIMPFGELETSDKFKINQIRSYPSDLNTYYQFPFDYNDQDTWGNYAEAKICNIAYNYAIPEYYLFRIQGRPDDPNSQLLTPQDQQMLDEYITGSVGEVVGKFNHRNANFSITVKKLNISKIPGIGNYKKVNITATNTDRKSVRITYPPSRDRKKPTKLSNSLFRTTWICMGCDSLSNYSLIVHNRDTKRTKSFKVNGKNYKNLELDPGNYRVNVQVEGIRSSDAYLEVEAEGGGGFWIFFILVALGGLGYLGYKYYTNMQEKTTQPNVKWEDQHGDPGKTNKTEQNETDDWD